MLRLALCFLTLTTACSMPRLLLPDPPLTVPELTGHRKTSTHAEVMEFLAAVDAAGDRRVFVTRFGATPEGRAQPLVVIADPPVRDAAAARASGKPVVWINANIHAGEVEGKEAVLALLREVVWGPEPWPVEDVVVLMAPIYNADGNDRMAPKNRPLQQGPSNPGQRASSLGLDLNRDGLKLENLEARNLTRALVEWDPHVFVDLHTTNGSAHGYELAYAPLLTPSAHPDLLAELNARWLPELRARMRERHGFETFDYGNFMSDGAHDFVDEVDLVKGWRTYDHRPRFVTNAAGLRNRLAILSEAYSYADFRTRIAATRAYVMEIIGYAAEQGPALPALCARLDEDTRTLAREGALTQHVEAEIALRGVEPLLLRGFELGRDPETGEEWRVAAGPRSTIEVPIYAGFTAKRSVTAPRAYVLGPELASVAALLRVHGVLVEDVKAPFEAEVTVFRLRSAKRAPQAFQGHHERSAEWQLLTETVRIPAGAFRVDLDQPAARLIFQLVDPRADDGCLTWNFYDRWLDSGAGVELPLFALSGAGAE
jgi:hypothetical protein